MLIKPNEIRTKASRCYTDILVSSIQDTPDFPIYIRFRKIKPKDARGNISLIRDELSNLINGSKEKKGYGYTIELIEKNHREIGKQQLPNKIFFETLDDYLKFIRRETEYHQFLSTVQQISEELPQLIPWIKSSPQKVIGNLNEWDDIIKVCKYFIQNPQPHIFIREIPLDISTKFIEKNTSIIRPLLNILIADYLNEDETNFNKRFNLKYDEKLVRFRILDSEIALEFFNGIDDMSIPQSQFNQLNIPCHNVFVVENKTNMLTTFLTMPSMEKSIAVFGKGFDIVMLKNAKWLSDKQIIYWGDIDPHGFQILSQMRSYFPQTQSCMMDFDTFREFEDLVVTGAYTNVTELQNLTSEEHLLFEHLSNLEKNNRLEQEKITHEYALKKIYDIVNI
ncbi:Wadjet anti-phage system protein JetD domain-containing protein [Methanolobus sp. ZRKC2]|uniref:Wadjet anti-phage system protein JetD domain-containing protein n=1 Tax=Methanolobus sp. ZRKC2 TaxID=3125783 RepID=UPI00324A2EC9